MSRGSEGRIGKMSLAVLDISFIHLGYLTVYWLSNESAVPFHYVQAAPWVSAIAFIIFYLFGFYMDWQRKSFQQMACTILLSLGIVAVLITIANIVYPMETFSTQLILTASLIHAVSILLSRLIIWQVIRMVHGRKRLLIIAEDEKNGLSLADKLLSHHKGWFIVSKLVTLKEKDKLTDCLKEIDVVLISDSINGKQRSELINLCAKQEKEVLVVPQLFEIFIHGSVHQQVDDMLVLSIPPTKLSGARRAVKRAFDFVVAAILLVAVSPVTICLWVLIPLTSKGPALFKQERLGRNGKPYQIYKFRSMVQNAEKDTGPVLATERDPRITAIGRLIRATRLDELPQLYNVLKGEMSLVGPRPERKFFYDQFQQYLPEYSNRMTVKPGLTGLAQVMANYTTAPEDKLRFDLMYIRHYSFGNDIKILFQTIWVIFQKNKAEGVVETNSQKKKRLLQLLSQNQAAGQ
ncbi:sugar transferase [Pseudobacillus sp. 179-B 2D1 NHS]|uniref:sugar transferase n=1 Tax=Pseudobacillus sp. 179-B 2D1 NHS TaxID=3374292 RepID=UPI0038798EAD